MFMVHLRLIYVLSRGQLLSCLFICFARQIISVSILIWRQVSEWGQLIVASNQFTQKSDWSDALFVQVDFLSDPFSSLMVS